MENKGSIVGLRIEDMRKINLSLRGRRRGWQWGSTQWWQQFKAKLLRRNKKKAAMAAATVEGTAASEAQGLEETLEEQAAFAGGAQSAQGAQGVDGNAGFDSSFSSNSDSNSDSGSSSGANSDADSSSDSGSGSVLGGAEEGNGVNPNFQLSRFRIGIVVLVVGSCIAFLLGRLLWIQLLYPDRLITEGQSRVVRNYKNEPARGLISDRNGKILAISVPMKVVHVDASKMHDSQVENDLGLLRKVADILEIEPKDLIKSMENPRLRHVRVKQYLRPDKAKELAALKLPWVMISNTYQRRYPTGAINAPLVGFLNSDGVGVYGIEWSFDHYLSAESSMKQALKDLHGHIIENVSVLDAGKPGGNLVLSIDDRLQTYAYNRLKETVNQHEARSACVVMMDVRTGEILAMVNYPSFDPNNRSVFNSELAKNRAVADTFEPGSTLKPFVALAALETGKVTWNEVFDTREYLVNGKRIRDSHRMKQATLGDIIKYSSNIGMAHIAQRVGPECILQMLERFGFGSSTNSGLLSEVNGRLNSGRPFWSEIDKATLGFGYGVTVTAVQLAAAYATLANYGARLPVSIMRVNALPAFTQVANVSEIKRMHMALETVVEQGSGGRAAINRYRIAGKTGTAHIASAGGYSNNYVSSFVGFAPFTNPRFVLVSVVFYPQVGSYFGGAVSAPVFRDVMTRALQLYNVAPDRK